MHFVEFIHIIEVTQTIIISEGIGTTVIEIEVHHIGCLAIDMAQFMEI